MKKINYSIPLRIVSVFTLFFFCWTFGGLFDIAYATKNEIKKVTNNKPKEKKPEEKFEKTLNDLEKVLIDTKTNTDTKKNKAKGKKDAIEALDVEIKKLFADTEKKLKDEGLPQEILERHYNFVNHYGKNLKELQKNLDDIEKAKTKTEADDAIENTKKFLEKVKPPKKHVPLDPNKLPHKTPEAKEVTLEERPPEKKIDSREFLKKRTELENIQHEIISSNQTEPILVASNGSLTGIIDSPLPNTYSQEPVLYAQTPVPPYPKNVPPSEADLAETIEVQFTPAIQAKAEELGHHPLKIYEWVRNNIEYVPTYGSIQGADMCLQTKLCNDIDTASLLIALLRVSGIHSQYVYGTKEIPIDKFMNWVGGFTDSMEALRLTASAKIPTKGLTVGGKIEYAQVEHVWIKAYVDYIPSRGARHKTGQGDTWIYLDASLKQYTYTQGIDIQSEVPFDTQSFIDQITSSATINEQEGYVTNVDSIYIQQTMTDYQTQVENYINEDHPNATVGDVLGNKEIVKHEFGILPVLPMYRTINIHWIKSDLPDNLRHKINFTLIKDMYDEITGTPINITKSLPELAGKKITLSYSPATLQDEAVINSLLPKPHADGSPIDPSELPTSLPAYLISLKPELRIDGVVVATGTNVGMGNTETFKMTFIAPKESPDLITNYVQAGEYLGIALNLGRISTEQLFELKNQIESLKAKLEAQDFSEIEKDNIIGNLLYATALYYHAKHDLIDYQNAKNIGVIAIRLPSESKVSVELSVNSFFGMPISVSSYSFAMDVDRIIALAKSLKGNINEPKEFILLSGMNGSALEHSVPEQLFSTDENEIEAISAVKALKLASDQGIPIYTIDHTNISAIIPQLQLDSETIGDIQSAINAGKVVIVSQTEITYNDWTGCGYIIIDPNTGAGAYVITEGLNGAFWYTLWFIGLVILIIAAAAGLAAIIALIAIFIAPILSAIAAAFSAIIPILVNIFYIASSSFAYLIPFLLPAAVYCMDLPGDIPWYVQGLCAIVLTILAIRAAK